MTDREENPGEGGPGPDGLARRIVERRFAIEAGALVVGGARLESVAAEHGTPFYLYDRGVVTAALAELRAVIPIGVELYYSVKANPARPILEAFVERGLGLEVASAGELDRALEAGCDPARIVFAGPGKTDAELDRALSVEIGELHVESAGEVARVAAIAGRLDRIAPVVLRVNPAGESTGAAMRMGGRASPFGIDEEALDGVVDRVIADGALDLLGVHLYVGTQILDAHALAGHARRAVEVAGRVAEQSRAPIRTIDVGGGLGVPYFAHEDRLDLDAYGRGLAAVLDEARRDPRLREARWILEPGRFLVAEAGLYVARVVDVKRSRGEAFVVLDGGMHHHLAASGNLGQVIPRPFPIVIPERMDEAPAGRVHLVGPLCTPLDVLGRDVALPPVEPGDLVAVLQSGAYARSASPLGFLSRPEPPEVWVGEWDARPREDRR